MSLKQIVSVQLKIVDSVYCIRAVRGAVIRTKYKGERIRVRSTDAPKTGLKV